MYDAIPDNLPDDLELAIGKAARALMDLQRADGHWVFELEADATIPAEFVLLKHYLGEPEDLELERKIGVYLRRIQGEHGGWALYHGGAFEVSASVKAYFALKMIGDDIDAPHMVRAREAILKAGGAAATNVFTRFQLALYGAGPWTTIPTMPVELILVPKWFPIHLLKMSYWARTVIVPLLVLQVKKPVARNARGIKVDELYQTAVKARPRSAVANRSRFWTWFFNSLDVVLKGIDPFWPRRLRQRAIDRCVAFVTQRLNGEDGLGAIYPAMANSVMMFDALGYAPDHPHRELARTSVERLLVIKDKEAYSQPATSPVWDTSLACHALMETSEGEAYCQPCVSPVWDTSLACHALLEAGGGEAERRVKAALDWLKPLQVLDVKGDWAEARPDVRPGGWAFQYNNAHYPDVDDTAVVAMAMDRAKKRQSSNDYDEAIDRGAEWIWGLQSKNGGWGAFDADNDHYYLNNIPFADHGALLDPPTVDVSARCIGLLAQMGVGMDDPRMKAAVAYIEQDQEADGSWFGRWGVNYIYGAWSALCGLNAAGVDPQAPMMRRAVDWLVRIQNPDGGWGESCDSYALDYQGYEPAESRASQTAWALLGLMAAGETDHPAVERGIAWLQQSQDGSGFWPEDHYTGGGFPRVFYLRYHGYSKFFPLWALARYRNLTRSNDRKVAWGL
jgi:squalene-hopene/tetraprenyl-beta-curcumene cyclase